MTINSRSESWSALALSGPRARDVLSACTDADLSNVGFRWLSAQDITVAGHTLLALRMSYAGELGWELHMPNDACRTVYEALWDAGAQHGIADYGSFAMNALRMEKAFKGARELTNEVTLPEADVMPFVNLDKEYLGADATRRGAMAASEGNLPWICAYLEIEPDGVNDGHGGEAVLRDGQVIGATTSVAYGHSVGTKLAFAYIDQAANMPGAEVEVVVAGTPRMGRILSEAAHDPASETAKDRRMKGLARIGMAETGTTRFRA